MLSISDSTSIDSDRSHILYTPYDVSSYMLYAKSLYENGLENEARKQVRIGKETVTSFPISFSPVFKSPEAVLGATTTLDDLEYSWNKKRGEAQKNYDYWKGIVKDKPDYRDGYIMLAFQTLSLQKYDEARVYIERALFIDPTNETAQKLKTTMSRKGI